MFDPAQFVDAVDLLKQVPSRSQTQGRFQATIDFTCALCKEALTPDEFDMINFAWPYAKGIKGGGPYFLLHKLCTHRYELDHPMIGTEDLPRLFNPRVHDYKSLLPARLYDPLVAFFRPKGPPVKLKFGKDTWVGDSHRLTLLPRERVQQVHTRQPVPLPTPPPISKPAKRHVRAGFVYLILAEGTPRIKIGHSVNAVGRLETLSTGSPYPLRLLRTIPAQDSERLEQELHTRYQVYCCHREWFELPDDVLAQLLAEDFA